MRFALAPLRSAYRSTIHVTAIVLLLSGTGVLVGCAGGRTTSGVRDGAVAPGSTVRSGPLLFTVWNSDPGETEAGARSLMLEIGLPVDSVNDETLRLLTLTAVGQSGKARDIEQKLLKVEKDAAVCIAIPVDGPAARLVIRGEMADGRTCGPVTVDFSLTRDVVNAETEFDLDSPWPDDRPCGVATPLGCVAKASRLTVTPLGQDSAGPVHYAVFTFRGRELLRFKRDGFRIRDAESGNTYLWDHWQYVGQMVFLPGSQSENLNGSQVRPIEGPIHLLGCRRIQVYFKIQEGVRRVRLEFDAPAPPVKSGP